MSRKNKKKKAEREDTQRILNDAAAIRGIERAEHFDNDGTLEQWRPSRKVHKSRAEKRTNRRTVRKKAVDEAFKDSND